MSMFDLPQSAAELVSGNQGTANAAYRQITATRDVTGTNFANGTMQFRFETGGTTWWIPDRSYFRLRCTMSAVRTATEGALPILSVSDLAPAMGLAANLFKTVEVQLNGKTIERVGERLAHIDALKTRMGKSKGFMDSIGKSTNFWDDDFNVRRNAIAVDGYQSHANTYEPTYGQAITPEAAGFDAANTVAYTAADNLLVFAVAVLPDIQKGAMALRPGDRITAGATHVLEIVRVLSALIAIAKPVGGTAGNGNLGATAAFTIQKIHDTTRNDTTGKSTFEIIWQPPLGFFDKTHAIPPGGLWNIEFDPETPTDVKRTAVESFLADRNPVKPLIAANVEFDFDFQVNQMYLYLYTVDANRFDNGSWFLDIQNVRVQEENMNQNQTGLIQKNFDVNGRTNALTLAFQDQQAGVVTRRMRSKFKIRPARTAPALPLPGVPGAIALAGQDLLLNRFYINYNNTQKPSPDFDGQYVELMGQSRETANPARQDLMQRYVDSMMNAGAYHTEGGAETFEEWLRRGPYYHFLWPKDALEENKRVNINYSFSRAFENLDPDGANSTANHKILLFNWWRTAYHIVHKNGRVEKMSVEEL